jgi:hypothetical protein
VGKPCPLVDGEISRQVGHASVEQGKNHPFNFRMAIRTEAPEFPGLD